MRRVLGGLALLACQCSQFVVDPPTSAGMAGGGMGGAAQGGGGAGPGGASGSTTGGQLSQRPSLADDVYTLLQGESFGVPANQGVLANDRPLSLRVRGAPRLISAVPEEFRGELTLEEDGSFLFRPEARFFGVYGVEYSAQNAAGQSSSARLWFRVLPRRISLEVVDAGLGGYVLQGSEFGQLGASLAAAGDIDLDGRADLLIGAPETAEGNGAAFLVYGKDDLGPVDVLSEAPSTATGVYTVFSGVAQERLGSSLSGLGDVDRDGRPDLALGASSANAGQGRVYVVAGSMFTRQFTLPDPSGIVIDGDAQNLDVGRVVAGAADVNGDGQRDLLFNSQVADYGWLHVMFGGSGVTGPVNVAGFTGLHLRGGSDQEVFPSALAAIEDINGDGRGEVLMADAQSVVLLFGGVNYPNHAGLLGIDGQGGGFRLQRSQAGWGSVSGLGDVNGDSLADFAYCDGRVCRVIFSPPVTLAHGWEFGGFSRRTTQVLVTGGADFDGDSFSDVVFAEPGRISVVYGRAEGHELMNVGELGAQGFSIEPGRSGTRISNVTLIGDVNRDGAPDLAIADAGWDSDSGRVYVVLGVPRISAAGP